MKKIIKKKKEKEIYMNFIYINFNNRLFIYEILIMNNLNNILIYNIYNILMI